MSGPELDLTVIVYGSNATDSPDERIRFRDPDTQRRLELKLHPTVPTAEMCRDQSQMNPWAQKVLLTIGPDVKHSQRWHCEFCNKPARETVQQVASWMHLQPPKLNAYIHNICDTSRGPCIELLRAVTPSTMAPLAPASGSSEELGIPMSASCAFEQMF
ncbi:hypothetical protein C8Q75DRAFT_732243 [Abortiporus biennis]|nr:hypothetical protein C8Q75DRAFT_732243 [Abortiporus biennis]